VTPALSGRLQPAADRGGRSARLRRLLRLVAHLAAERRRKLAFRYRVTFIRGRRPANGGEPHMIAVTLPEWPVGTRRIYRSFTSAPARWADDAVDAYFRPKD
jgi:hypothetical protein